jgi:hydrogenase nickel incorporation protein HypA/HybF
MHELGITQNIMEIVQDEAGRAGLDRVTCVKLRVGRLTAIVPDAMDFCFGILKKGTIAEEATLVITEVPLRASCTDCGEDFTVEAFSMVCPRCGGRSLTILSGRELEIESIEGEQEDESDGDQSPAKNPEGQ